MALVQMPAGAVFTKRDWTPPSQNQVNRSRWTGARKVLRLPGAGIWRVSAALKPISTEAEAWPWKAFLSVLEGEANTFPMPFACEQYPADGVTVKSGGVQGAAGAVRLQGIDPAGQLALRAGQGMTFEYPNGKRQLVVLTQPLVADSNGEAVAFFRSNMRQDAPPGTRVEVRNPYAEMSMASPVPIVENEGIYTVAFDAEEAFG